MRGMRPHPLSSDKIFWTTIFWACIIVSVLQHQVADNVHQQMSTISRVFINNYYYSCVLQFQSRHNSHTGHCYVISFAACKRIDVIITITKTAIFCFMSPGMQKVGVRKKNFASGASEIVPHLQNRGAAPGLTFNGFNLNFSQITFLDHSAVPAVNC